MNSVAKVYIGLGDRNSLDPGGEGTVVFDDVRLYRRKCVPARRQPAMDFDDDCTVDFVDVMLMAEDWLRTDVNFLDLGIVPQAPGAAVAWWKLEQSDGTTAVDYINGYHGVLEGDYEWTGGHDGGTAVEFENGKVLVPDAAGLKPLYEVSVSAWVYYSENQSSARIVVKGADDKETYYIQIDDDDASFQVRDANNKRFEATNAVWRKEWVHIGGTFDGDSNSLRCYVNGQLVGKSAEKTNVTFVTKGGTLSQDTNDLAIGNRSDANDREFEGIIDDVRLYNYALSEAEVVWLASGGSGFVPLRSQFNVYDGEPADRVQAVNFRDLTMLAEEWLKTKLWPPE
jgi:hypothetical protein